MHDSVIAFCGGMTAVLYVCVCVHMHDRAHEYQVVSFPKNKRHAPIMSDGLFEVMENVPPYQT